jgi:2-iminobutanoate/2-iminopropanoate deaminase
LQLPKRELKSEKLYAPPRGGVFSTAIEAPAGRTIYVSGLTSRNKEGAVVGKGNIKVQTETILQNMQTILAEAGATMDDIVKLTVFIRHMELFDEIHHIRRAYFEEPYPASSMVEVSMLADPDLLIEIEAVAVVE